MPLAGSGAAGPGQGEWLGAIAQAFTQDGIDLGAWALAWARTAPVVAIVPAFGLRALPAPVRAATALVFAALLLPAVAAEARADFPLPLLIFAALVRGLTVALAAAIPFWIATMAGGLVDTLRGAQDGAPLPVIEGRATPIGALLSLLASAIFLFTGGPARVVALLAQPGPAYDRALALFAADLAAGVGVAVALAAPLVAAAVVLEIAGALIARAASPAQLHATLGPMRSLALLALAALLLDRIAGALALLLAP